MHRYVKIRATNDFYVGPNGYHLAVAKGQVRKVFLDKNERFFTVPDSGKGAFGSCKIGSGWEIIEELGMKSDQQRALIESTEREKQKSGKT